MVPDGRGRRGNYSSLMSRPITSYCRSNIYCPGTVKQSEDNYDALLDTKIQNASTHDTSLCVLQNQIIPVKEGHRLFSPQADKIRLFHYLPSKMVTHALHLGSTCCTFSVGVLGI